MNSVQRTIERAAPSINSTGDIVTYCGREYRWRDGDVFQRIGENDLKKIEWRFVPQVVRDKFTECA